MSAQPVDRLVRRPRGALRSSLALVLVLAIAPLDRARADSLSVDLPVTAGVTGAALAVWGAAELAKDQLTPPTCRWCEPPALDRNVRSHLVWSDTNLASGLSDALLVGVPASLMVSDYLLSGRDLGRTGEDALVVVEAVAVTGVATQAFKYGFARRRPYAWASGQRGGPDDDNSFVSGHASAAFASAGALGTVAMLRGYSGWPFVYAAGFTGATIVSYLRVAADKHWLTDVAAGAVVGAAFGVGLPLLLHRDDHGSVNAHLVVVAPMSIGFAGKF